MKLKASELKTNPNNPRFIKDDKFKKLVQSLKDFPEMADVREVVINKEYVILGGNMRYKAMQEAGWKDIPVKVVDWPEDKQREFIIKDNVSGGEWDWDLLANEWDNGLLDDWGLDLPGGFGQEEGEEDEAPEVSADPPLSKLGEIYQLGRHRVMCGDSTDGENVNSLMGGQIATLMVTDPPYGVNYDPEWRDGADLGIGDRSRGKVLNDDKADWLEAFELFGGDVAYVWHASQQAGIVYNDLVALGFKPITHIIWVKQHFALSRGDYHWQHEPCWYVVRDGRPHNWQGARDQSSVWEIKNNNSFGNSEKEETWGHGTQKPIECMARPIRNNSANGESIYDPFGGSGSTLIACEQLDRTCYMMELDPKYVDVIRKRYAKYLNPENWEAEWQSMTPAIKS